MGTPMFEENTSKFIMQKGEKFKMNDLQNRLFAMQDLKYKEFHQKLIPNVDPDLVIGVRTPELRKFAKEFSKTGESEQFLKSLPHKYYEENNLHAFLIEQLKDFNLAIEETERFLPYVDNWATCDMFSPKVFKKNTDKLLIKIKEWLNSDKVYTVRYAIGLLMKLYSDDKFSPEYPKMVANIVSDEYYINMMRAWYFATLLCKQYDVAITYIEDKRLDSWTHNKAIQKAVESNRISKEVKTYLKSMRNS